MALKDFIQANGGIFGTIDNGLSVANKGIGVYNFLNGKGQNPAEYDPSYNNAKVQQAQAQQATAQAQAQTAAAQAKAVETEAKAKQIIVVVLVLGLLVGIYMFLNRKPAE